MTAHRSPATGLCGYCGNPLPGAMRRDAKYCGQPCRQAAHRLGRGARSTAAALEPQRFGYADPPYPKLAARYYRHHPDYAGEVDHGALVERLCDEFPDGWALSTSAVALGHVLRLCPADVHVAAWVRGARHTSSHYPLGSWEPVIVRGGRPDLSGAVACREDSLVHAARPRVTDPDRVTGAKPPAFCYWLFDLLGARPGDELVDLFPGSGAVAHCWAVYTARAQHPSLFTTVDASAGSVALDVGGDG